MKKNQNTMVLFGDFVSYLFTLFPMIGAYSALILWIQFALNTSWILIILSPLSLVLSFIFIVGILKTFIPKLKRGVTKVGLNKNFIAWYLNLGLERSIRVSQIQELILSFSIFKFLYWKAMRANIAFGINSSVYVNLIDLSLITIEEGCTIGDRVTISCHTLTKDALILRPVTVKKNSLIGTHSKLYLGTEIGENSMIGGNNVLFKKKFPDNSKVSPGEYKS